MDPYDEARAFEKMLKIGRGRREKYGVLSLSKEIGVPERTIRDALDLLDEPKFVEKAITEKGIPKTLFVEARISS